MVLILNASYQEGENGYGPGNISGSDMTVQECPPRSPLVTAVAKAEDCFCQPQFLHLFNGG